MNSERDLSFIVSYFIHTTSYFYHGIDGLPLDSAFSFFARVLKLPQYQIRRWENTHGMDCYILSIAPCTRVPPAALKKKNPTTHKQPAKINPRIAARPLDELIRPLWAESKGFQYIP
jgi:hypothetical protein